MTTNDDSRRDVALFRYGLIADLLVLPAGSREIAAGIRDRAARDHAIPGTRRTRVGEQTMRDWLRLYRAGGFDALFPKRRRDGGKPRRLTVDAAEALIAVKRENPAFSVRDAIARVREDGDVLEDVPLPPSTVHRLLSSEGLMESGDGSPPQDRRRFEHPNAGDLWMSDVMHGPKCGDGRGRRRKTYLVAFIDDCTRVVPDAAFAFSETTAAFLPVFRTALLRRGFPARLYVDNGASFRSRHLALVCARLGVVLVHARPYHAAGKGKIERWFRTVRRSVLERLDDGDTRDLEALNRRLRAWIEGEYHMRPHRGLGGMTPLDKWSATAGGVRHPGPGLDLDDLFLFEARRRVAKDRTVSLRSRLYEADPALVGETVTLRFDPAAPGRPLKVVHDGRDAGLATPLDVHANAAVRRGGDRDGPPASSIAFRDLGGNGEDGR